MKLPVSRLVRSTQSRTPDPAQPLEAEAENPSPREGVAEQDHLEGSVPRGEEVVVPLHTGNDGEGGMHQCEDDADGLGEGFEDASFALPPSSQPQAQVNTNFPTFDSSGAMATRKEKPTREKRGRKSGGRKSRKKRRVEGTSGTDHELMEQEEQEDADANEPESSITTTDDKLPLVHTAKTRRRDFRTFLRHLSHGDKLEFSKLNRPFLSHQRSPIYRMSKEEFTVVDLAVFFREDPRRLEDYLRNEVGLSFPVWWTLEKLLIRFWDEEKRGEFFACLPIARWWRCG